MRILKLILFCIVLCLLASIGYGQKVNFGGTTPTQTAWAARFLQIDSAIKLLKYATSDTNLVLGFDAFGNGVLRTKGGGSSGSGTVTSIKFNYPLTGGTISTSGTVNLPIATPSVTGALDSNDFAMFLAKQDPISISTIGTSGPASYDGISNINIPVYQSALGFTPENVANKATSFAVLNNTLYPSTSAVNTQINAALAGYQPTGNYITALTGDITASGPGIVAATIANGVVTNDKIANTTIDLTAKVTGVLPMANGGTNATTTTSVNGTPITYGANNTLPVGAGTVTSVGLVAGASMSVTGTSPITGAGTFTVVNTAPDQTVALNNGIGISVTGTYPTFTVTNTSPSSGGTVTSVSGTTNQIDVATGTSTAVVSLHSGGTLPGAWALGTPASMVATNVTGTAAGLTVGTASTVTTNANLTGPVTSIGNATSIANSGVTASTYGSATQVPTVTVTADGRVTSMGNVTISGTTPGGSAGGDLTGTYPNPTIATVNATPATYGGASAIPIVTVNNKGQVTTITTVSPSVTASNTVTFTNKAWTPRTFTTTNVTTSVTINADLYDIYEITAQAGALLFNAPSGTPVDGQILEIIITDNGTARALTYNAVFTAWGQPTTTVISKPMIMVYQYSVTETAWRYVGGKTKP